MTCRKDGQTKVIIPKEWEGSKFHLYVFAHTNGTTAKKPMRRKRSMLKWGLISYEL